VLSLLEGAFVFCRTQRSTLPLEAAVTVAVFTATVSPQAARS
jgi:hypothetical protein